MTVVNITLSKENDDWLRNQNRRKGDMSRIVNKLLDEARLKAAPVSL